MGNSTIIPFGPQHPVLPEPLHLDLEVEDEKIINVIPSLGFVHRGLEKLVEKFDFMELVFVAERICGICSFIHGMTLCQGIEDLMGMQVPPRAVYLRTIWAELSRIHSHLMWLGLLADALGFENLFMNCWRIREAILDIIEETTGGRVIFGSCKVGGVRRNIENSQLKEINTRLESIKKDFKDITGVFLKDYSVRHRLSGVGILSKEDAHSLGAVGPFLRASGIEYDIRETGYSAYGELEFIPVVENDCDCYARTVVRIKEIFQSVDIIGQCVGKMPDSEIDIKVTGTPSGEIFTRTEQPRGEVVYYLKANGTKNLSRFRVRTPTFANIPAMIKMLKGCEIADVPVIILSIDPCISCTER